MYRSSSKSSPSNSVCLDPFPRNALVSSRARVHRSEGPHVTAGSDFEPRPTAPLPECRGLPFQQTCIKASHGYSATCGWNSRRTWETISWRKGNVMCAKLGAARSLSVPSYATRRYIMNLMVLQRLSLNAVVAAQDEEVRVLRRILRCSPRRSDSETDWGTDGGRHVSRYASDGISSHKPTSLFTFNSCTMPGILRHRQRFAILRNVHRRRHRS